MIYRWGHKNRKRRDWVVYSGYYTVADVQKCKYKKLSGVDLAVLKDYESILES